MTLQSIEKTITKYLKKHFNDRGQKDFYFKSSDLPLTINNRVIGRVLKNYIATKGLVELWSTRRHSVNVWRTCFNGGL